MQPTMLDQFRPVQSFTFTYCDSHRAVLINSVVSALLILILMAAGQGRASSSPLHARSLQETKERDAQRPELPDTTLGRIMRHWFAVIQSGKEGEIKSFVEDNFSSNAFRR